MYLPDERKGSSAFIITAGQTIVNKIVGYNKIPGLAHEQNAYRSELGGIDGILSVLEVIVDYYNITHGAIELALDGKSALEQANLEDFLQAGQSSFGILQDIHYRIRHLPILVSFRWVEGHQRKKGKQLDWRGRQNELVDMLAKNFLWRNLNHWIYKSSWLWYEQWAIYLHRSKISSISNKTVYLALQ